MSRRHVASGGPLEESGGYSRALAVGDLCWIVGTTDAGPDGILCTRAMQPGRRAPRSVCQMSTGWALVRAAQTTVHRAGR